MPASQWVSGQLVWAWTTLILVSITWVSEYIDNLGDDEHTYDGPCLFLFPLPG